MGLLKDILVALIFLPLAICYGACSKKIRPTLAERLGGGQWRKFSDQGGQWLWIHGASVGELAAIEPLLKNIHQTWPTKKILITATSATGCHRAKDLPHVSFAVVLPFDLRLLYRRALRHCNIERLIVLETELWPSLFSFANSKAIETVILNARISDETFPRYLRHKWYFSRLFKSVAMIFAQSELDAQRYFKLGVLPQALVVNGSTKFDIEFAPREQLQAKFGAVYGLDKTRPTLTIGCLRKEEESLMIAVLQVVLQQIPNLQVIIVPRHPERFVPVAKELQRIAIDFHLRSAGANTSGKSIVLVDAMGELAATYALAEVAIVCGAFSNAGGHNPLEAAVVGTAVLIGPQHFNVRAAVDVLSKYSALQIVDGKEQIVAQIVELFADPQRLSAMQKNAQLAAGELTGASQRFVSYLKANDHVA